MKNSKLSCRRAAIVCRIDSASHAYSLRDYHSTRVTSRRQEVPLCRGNGGNDSACYSGRRPFGERLQWNGYQRVLCTHSRNRLVPLKILAVNIDTPKSLSWESTQSYVVEFRTPRVFHLSGGEAAHRMGICPTDLTFSWRDKIPTNCWIPEALIVTGFPSHAPTTGNESRNHNHVPGVFYQFLLAC